MPTLVIVESPAKAKTLGRFLGREYVVRASLGHVRDLPPRELGVDVEHNFKPAYHVLIKKRKVLAELRAALQNAERVVLATDPDREGEAIAWHLLQVLRPRVPVQRVAFHEITEPAVRAAFAQPRAVDMHMVDAQQARRVLDRLVGYQISPLLWRTIGGKSAGRVQSVALRLVVDREREIRNFVPDEYWTIHADLAKLTDHKQHFLAKLIKIGAKTVELKSKADADGVLAALEGARYAVSKIKREKKERRPWPPFTTSTMQQAASARLHMAPAETMKHAQKLYEGVALGEGKPVGLITYMRTDSTAISPEAQSAARAFIGETYGAQYLPERAPVYASRVKNAQEAHEAVRPTDVRRTPEALKDYLDKRQWQLYDLIWRRFVASQMKPALYDVTTVDVEALARDTGRYLFRAIGRELLFDGFLRVLDEPEEAGDDDDAPQRLPPLAESEVLDLLALVPRQHFTKPPPRYTEAALIKALEERGIGRPSTYAQIMATIKEREYVALEQRRLVPTALGEGVCDALVATFPSVMDYAFTAQIEDQLDDVSRGERGWSDVLAQWYGPFSQALAGAKDILKTMPRAPKSEPANGAPAKGRGRKRKQARAAAEPVGAACPQCGKPLVKRSGKFGEFVGCSGYPDCRYIAREAPVPAAGAEPAPAKRTRKRKTANTAVQAEAVMEMTEDTMLGNCPQCGKPLAQKSGKYGPFVGCTGYPDCRYIVKDGKIGKTPAAPAAQPPLSAGTAEPGWAVDFGEEDQPPDLPFDDADFAGMAPPEEPPDFPLFDDVPAAPGRRASEAPVDMPAGSSELGSCPQCGRPLVQKSGKYGPFVGCSGYPECRYIVKDGKLGAAQSPAAQSPAAQSPAAQPAAPLAEGLGNCPECGRPLAQKSGKYGPFVGCTGYPECRYILRGAAVQAGARRRGCRGRGGRGRRAVPKLRRTAGGAFGPQGRILGLLALSGLQVHAR